MPVFFILQRIKKYIRFGISNNGTNYFVMRRLFFLIAIVLPVLCRAGDSIQVKVDLRFRGQQLELNKRYISVLGDTIKISKLRFYLAGFGSNGKPANYHLIDASVPESMRFYIADAKSATIRIGIGVDSIPNTSGALGGDLDPANGMYWAWQSGYINLKIEGTSSKAKTRKHEFEFHLGGYKKPFSTFRQIQVPASITQLTVDLATFFDDVDIEKNPRVMIPGKEAVMLTGKSLKMFSAQ